jgi:hypothetical protein
MVLLTRSEPGQNFAIEIIPVLTCLDAGAVPRTNCNQSLCSEDLDGLANNAASGIETYLKVLLPWQHTANVVVPIGNRSTERRNNSVDFPRLGVRAHQ